jgi:hypothetical protein
VLGTNSENHPLKLYRRWRQETKEPRFGVNKGLTVEIDTEFYLNPSPHFLSKLASQQAVLHCLLPTTGPTEAIRRNVSMSQLENVGKQSWAKRYRLIFISLGAFIA